MVENTSVFYRILEWLLNIWIVLFSDELWVSLSFLKPKFLVILTDKFLVISSCFTSGKKLKFLLLLESNFFLQKYRWVLFRVFWVFRLSISYLTDRKYRCLVPRNKLIKLLLQYNQFPSVLILLKKFSSLRLWIITFLSLLALKMLLLKWKRWNFIGACI